MREMSKKEKSDWGEQYTDPKVKTMETKPDHGVCQVCKMPLERWQFFQIIYSKEHVLKIVCSSCKTELTFNIWHTTKKGQEDYTINFIQVELPKRNINKMKYKAMDWLGEKIANVLIWGAFIFLLPTIVVVDLIYCICGRTDHPFIWNELPKWVKGEDAPNEKPETHAQLLKRLGEENAKR